MYERKILLIKEYDKAYTAKKKTLGGAVALLCNGKTTKISVNLTNIDSMRAGDWTVFIACDGFSFGYPLSSVKELPFPSIKSVSAVFSASGKAVAYADSTGKINADLLRKYFNQTESQTAAAASAFGNERSRFKNKTESVPEKNAPRKNESDGRTAAYEKNAEKETARGEVKIKSPQGQTKKNERIYEQPEDWNFARMFAGELTEYAAKKNRERAEKESLNEMTEYEKFILSSDDYYISEEEDETPVSGKKRGAAASADKEKTSKENCGETEKNGGETANGEKKNIETKADLEDVADMKTAKEAVGKYAEVFGENAGKSGFYAAVKNELSALFETFPVCAELTEKIKNSIWARIAGKKGDYFALGLLLCGGEPKYICYALPIRKDMFSNKSFFLNVGDGYRVVAQDAETGRIAEKVNFGVRA